MQSMEVSESDIVIILYELNAMLGKGGVYSNVTGTHLTRRNKLKWWNVMWICFCKQYDNNEHSISK